MLRRKLIILSLLLVAFLTYSQSTHIVRAEEPARLKLHPGSSVAECILLQENTPTYIKVIRDTDIKSPLFMCAEKVEEHRDKECKTYVRDIPIVEGKKPPNTEAYGVGNQPCKESIAVYTINNPGWCFEYHSGCNTRYIPPG